MTIYAHKIEEGIKIRLWNQVMLVDAVLKNTKLLMQLVNLTLQTALHYYRTP